MTHTYIRSLSFSQWIIIFFKEIEIIKRTQTPVIWTCQSREAYDEMIVQAERQNTEILFKTELFDLESDEKGVVSYLQVQNLK